MTTWASSDHGFDSIGGVSVSAGIEFEFPGENMKYSKIDPGLLRKCLVVIRICIKWLLMF